MSESFNVTTSLQPSGQMDQQQQQQQQPSIRAPDNEVDDEDNSKGNWSSQGVDTRAVTAPFPRYVCLFQT
jgi:hypothetical protein